jgi:hypothetical protein
MVGAADVREARRPAGRAKDGQRTRQCRGDDEGAPTDGEPDPSTGHGALSASAPSSERGPAIAAVVRVPGFLPSTAGFHFPNSFPSAPALTLGSIGIGNASNGLCGGMAFAALDLRAAGRTPPPDTAPPAPGSPWFKYLVRRLLASWGLPMGGLRYLWWTILPDRDVALVRGVAHRTRRWIPKVRAMLDDGRPVALGVIRVRSWNLLKVGLNHQMVGYGSEDAPVSTRLLVYDPNHPDRDDLAITVPLSEPPGSSPLGYLEGELPVRGFFITRYRPKVPPA